MVTKNVWQSFLIGGVIGYVVAHPLVMISAQAMSATGTDGNVFIPNAVAAGALLAFSYNMLPWSLGFMILSGTVGLLLAKIQQVRMQKLKLQAIMELAGATCHELNQPMQVVLGYAEMFSKHMLKTENADHIYEEIAAQIKRMDVILKKIKNITSYETCEYVRGIKIIDIEKSSKNNEVCKVAQL